MLLATATAPGAPSDIIAGVKTKAPPEPMNPLNKPATRPMTIRAMIFCGVISMNIMEISLITFSPVSLSRVTITFLLMGILSSVIGTLKTSTCDSLFPSLVNTAVRFLKSTLVNRPVNRSLGGGAPPASTVFR